MERSILKLPLSKLRAVPFALQTRALFEAENGRKGAEKRGGRGVASKGGKKEKRTRENRSVFVPDPDCSALSDFGRFAGSSYV